MTATAEIQQFIVQNFLYGQESALPGPDESLMNAGVIDSTGVLELVGFLEGQFGIKVDDSDLVPDNLDSLNRLAEYVQRKQAGVNA